MPAAPGGEICNTPRLVLADRAVRALHLKLLREAPPIPQTITAERKAALLAAARQEQTDGFTRQDWMALLSDADTLEHFVPDAVLS